MQNLAQKQDLTNAKVERISTEIELSKTRKQSLRLYRYEGQLGCSVSTATSLVVPYHRQEWYKRTSENKIKEISTSAAGKGTDGHALIEADSKERVEQAPEGQEKFLEQWRETEAKYKITDEASEFMVFSQKFAYGGQIDRLGEFDGKRCIIDWKSGRYNVMDLWKTVAYRNAYIEMTGDKDVGAVVVYLPRQELIERGFKPRHYTIQNYESCLGAFLSSYYTFKMTYYKELLKAGMAKEDVFSHWWERL